MTTGPRFPAERIAGRLRRLVLDAVQRRHDERWIAGEETGTGSAGPDGESLTKFLDRDGVSRHISIPYRS